MPDIINFEDENGVDTAGAMESATRTIQHLAWDDTDLLFYFQQLEAKMAATGVKKQYTKFQILSTFLPKRVQDQVKPLLRMKESEFTNNNAYRKLKDEVLRIFGPRPEQAVERALNRVMTGRPSDLARELVNDICEHQLDGCCCPKIILALWRRHLPSYVKARIAGHAFNKDTYNEILQLADNTFESTAPPSGQVAAIAAVQTSQLDETQPTIPYATPEVAAVSRGGRGGRGGRGFRGGGRGRGNRGGWRGGGGNQNNQGGGQNNSQGGNQQTPGFRGPKHPDLPAGTWSGCQMHHRWGRGAFFCSDPLSCPWKDVIAPKPNK